MPGRGPCSARSRRCAISGLGTIQNLITKEETVYVTLNTDGKVKDIIVSDWLHSDKPLQQIQDKSDLKNIKNVKGDEAPTINNTSVIWEKTSNDIFYQGETTKQLPIQIKITYYLDEKEMKPEELLGKNGHLKIKIDFIQRNNNNNLF